MAVDKLVDSTQLDADLTSVANAIRTKGGTSAQLAFPAGFVDAINAIETGGGGGESYEILEITLPTKQTAQFTIPHSLGRVPSFVMIALKNNVKFESGGDRYGIAIAMTNLSVGATDFNTSTGTSVEGPPAYLARTNNNTSMFNATRFSNNGDPIIHADANNVYVKYFSTSTGHLSAQTYKVVVG